MRKRLPIWCAAVALFIGIANHNSLAQDPLEAEDKTTARAPEIEVAIIIDDLGYNRQLGLDALALQGDLTYAVIPNSPNAIFLAKQASLNEKEIMLHAPMSNLNDFPLGDSGLTEVMHEADFLRTLSDSIQSLPNISGVNNHMGSLLTQMHLPMEWTMRTLHQQGLYFIDSWTTPQSIAWKTAQEHNVPSLKRDVFLDNDPQPEAIKIQFNHFIKVAKKRGYAIAIAHPYPETIAFLREHLSHLKEQGINLVPASKLVHQHSPNRQQS